MGRSRAMNSESRVTISPLDTLAVKLVCDQCNNGWMNTIEHRMASVAEWCGSRSLPLSPTHLDSLGMWALKTYFVLSAIEGGIRSFGGDQSDLGVIPDVTRARQLYQADAQAFEGVTVALARFSEEGRFGYIFGNPTVVPQGPRYANRRSAGSAVITLGRLQIWIVVPLSLFSTARVTLPGRVRRARVGLRFGALRTMPLIPSLDDIVVDNGEHDIVNIFERLQAWAEAW
jgi:hypothetical protein